MNRRSDRLTALLIDAAIHAAASHGPIGAARELLDAGVPWEVVMRVLHKPDHRRTYPRLESKNLESKMSVTWIRHVHAQSACMTGIRFTAQRASAGWNAYTRHIRPLFEEWEMNRRRDYKTALLIDAVIYSRSAELRAHASNELAERRLPSDFSVRIFLEPSRRRHNPPDQPAESPV